MTSDELQRYLESQEQLNHVYVVLGYFHDAFDQAQERNSRTQHRFLGPQQQAELDNALHEAIAQFEEVQKETSTEAAIRRLEQAATQAEASATAASKAAGKTADDTVSSHFQSMAANEAEAADKFRLWTMAAMGLGGIIATIYLLGPVVGLSGLEIGTGDYVHLLQRVLVVGAIFAFAAYTGRQAHNHRTQANWADSLAVQLQSFDAYCDAIADQASKDQLRTTFAARAFGEHPALRGGSSPESGDALIQKAADLVSKIIPGDKS
ncbi:hypothetical protein JOF48_002764 [Arthrobacter stackebrandtii]|uniref:Uncharacterized protein n=1 Tax=Arthrobacter stackebrandtii TaxID=272161 RepID=A0ABS4YYT7_9MICC|nr:hypothetical protein [Arthrobacter stackebrandtii]MBP2413965.1 hypothetical protein [Arthrobacter stackebrandtii]